MRICYTIFCTFVCVQKCPQQKVKMNNQISINNPNLLNSILFTVVSSEFLCELTGLGGGRGGGGRGRQFGGQGEKGRSRTCMKFVCIKGQSFYLDDLFRMAW